MVKVLVVDVSAFAANVDSLDLPYLRDRDEPETSPLDVGLLTKFLSGDDEAARKFCTYSNNSVTSSTWRASLFADLTAQGWEGGRSNHQNSRALTKRLRHLLDTFSSTDEKEEETSDVKDEEHKHSDQDAGDELVLVLGEVTRTVASLLTTLLDRGVHVHIFLFGVHLTQVRQLRLRDRVGVLDSSVVGGFVRPELRPSEPLNLLQTYIDAGNDGDLPGDEADVESLDGDSDGGSAEDSYEDSDEDLLGINVARKSSEDHEEVHDDEGDADDDSQVSALDEVSDEESEESGDASRGSQANPSDNELAREGGSGGGGRRGNSSDEEGSLDIDTESSASEESSSNSDDRESDDSDLDDGNDVTNNNEGQEGEIDNGWDNRQEVHLIPDYDDDLVHRQNVHLIPPSDDEFQTTEVVQDSQEEETHTANAHLHDIPDEDDETVSLPRLPARPNQYDTQFRYERHDTTGNAAKVDEAATKKDVSTFSPRFHAIIALLVAIILAAIFG